MVHPKSDFLPPGSHEPVLGDDLGHSIKKQRRKVDAALGGAEFLTRGRALPDASRHLVAAGVNRRQRGIRLPVHFHDVIHDIPQKLVRRRHAYVDDVVVPALHGLIHRLIVRMAKQETPGGRLVSLLREPVMASLHGHDRSPGVAGYVDLGYNLDVALSGIAEDPDEGLAVVVSAAHRDGWIRIGTRPERWGEIVSFGGGVAAERPYLRQFR